MWHCVVVEVVTGTSAVRVVAGGAAGGRLHGCENKNTSTPLFLGKILKAGVTKRELGQGAGGGKASGRQEAEETAAMELGY